MNEAQKRVAGDIASVIIKEKETRPMESYSDFNAAVIKAITALETLGKIRCL